MTVVLSWLLYFCLINSYAKLWLKKTDKLCLQKNVTYGFLYAAEHVLQHCCHVSSLYFSFSHRPAVSLEPSVFGFGGRCHWKDTASHRYVEHGRPLNTSQSRRILASAFHLCVLGLLSRQIIRCSGCFLFTSKGVKRNVWKSFEICVVIKRSESILMIQLMTSPDLYDAECFCCFYTF